MKVVIREITWMPSLVHCGWGNGYVLIPEGHELHGVDYNEIDVDVHGGLTFSELVTEEMAERWGIFSPEDIGMWCIGFDTAHYGDTKENWSKEAVQKEAEMLRVRISNNGI